MLLTATDAISNAPISFNPDYVVAVFVIVGEVEQSGKTAINLLNGNLVVTETYEHIVSMINK